MNRLDNHTDPEPVWKILGDAIGDLAFDIGANIGQSTKVLAQNFYRVIAFEPCQESYDILAEECDACVVPFFAAVSDYGGTVTLTETESHIQTGQLTTGEGLHWGPKIGTRDVPSVTIDEMTGLFGQPDFVKIDTEGHEVHVIRGGMSLFASKAPEVLIEVHDKKNEQPIRDLLLGYHFTKLEHESLRPESEIRQNHFWLWGTV